MQAYFEDELGIKVPLERKVDDILRGPLGDLARDKLLDGNIPELDLTVPEVLGQRLQAIYGPSNTRLASMVNFDPEQYGYFLA
jgi:hypothetical protein